MKVEVPVAGMDCASCASHVREAIAGVPGVASVEVLLASEKALIHFRPGATADLDSVRQAVEAAGYSVPVTNVETAGRPDIAAISRKSIGLLGMTIGGVLAIVIAGEWFGLLRSIGDVVPFWVGILIVLLVGYPVYINVVRAALRRKIIAHTMMSMGSLTALAVGEWTTAALVVFFMRIGDFVEHATTDKARSSVRDLMALAPRTARLLRAGDEVEVPIEALQVGDVVAVRPGEQIPVDGVVASGFAAVDQSAITGESMPVNVAEGAKVYAASTAGGGSLRVRATAIGQDSTFGRIIQMVEGAERHQGRSQRLADRFTAWYFPVVAVVALLAWAASGNVMNAVAVTVVACSCAFALATPVAMLASIGAAARTGVLVKGGRYMEELARVDTVLVDKTGTLTLGRPRVTDVVQLDGIEEPEILRLAATAEYDSEHPLAEAVRRQARENRIPFSRPETFEAVPGLGIRAHVEGAEVFVGAGVDDARATALRDAGKTVFSVVYDGRPVGLIAVQDAEREGLVEVISRLRALGIRHIELLTGDDERVAAALASRLGIGFRAGLLPEDKIDIVRQMQEQGRNVMMVGDGVNDVPALARADVGVAMGAAGTQVALQAAPVALMREDWMLVPDLILRSRKTMRVVALNLAFTTVYNIVGLSLAAFGILPPVFAAALQSIPDIGIMANSSRLIRSDV